MIQRYYLTASLSLFSTCVKAGLPASSKVTGASTGDGASMVKYLLKTYGGYALLAVGLFVAAGVSWYGWQSFSNAIKKQEWGGFLATSFGGLALLGAVVGILIFANTLISDL